jgi:predicted hotdog family 3-hydroxylacyl-ACP dehydratase
MSSMDERIAVSIADLLPHAGAMILIEAIVACDDRSIVCTSSRHRDPGNPLRDDGRLSSLAGVEFAAQAMALHGALRRSPPRALAHGRLVALRDVEVATDTLDAAAAPLRIECVMDAASTQATSYAFTISAAGALVVRGRATVWTGSEPSP